MSRTLIVGGINSIGLQIINDLSQMNCEILATGTKPDGKEKLSSNLTTTKYLILDIENENSIINFTKNNFEVDSVIYLSAIHYFNSLRNFSKSKFLKMVNVNSIGFIEILQRLLREQSVNKSQLKLSSAVYMSSIASVRSEIGLLDYSLSKSMGVSAVRNLALELAKFNVRVNAVSPGWIESERSHKNQCIMTKDRINEIRGTYPLGTGHPKDISNLVCFLISDKSKWITGQNFIIDGGRCLN